VKHPAGLAEEARDVAGTIVGHDALDPDALALEPAQGTDQEAGDRLALFVRQDLDVGEPRGVVDRDVDEFPASPLALAAPIAGDAMADAAEADELLDVEVDELAGACAIVVPRRLAGLERRQPAQTKPAEMSGDGAAWQTKPHGDLLRGLAGLTSQPGDHGEPGRWQLVGGQVRRRAAVLQAGPAFAAKAGEPLADGARADLEGGRDRGHAPALLEHTTDHRRSTERRRAGTVVSVHRVRPPLAGDGSYQPPAKGTARMNKLLRIHS